MLKHGVRSGLTPLKKTTPWRVTVFRRANVWMFSKELGSFHVEFEDFLLATGLQKFRQPH